MITTLALSGKQGVILRLPGANALSWFLHKSCLYHCVSFAHSCISWCLAVHFICSYEPELFPGLIYRMVKPRIVLLIFVSGKVVLTGKLGLFLSAAVCCYSVSFSLRQYVAARSLSLCGSMLLLGLFLSAAVCCGSVSFSLQQYVAARSLSLCGSMLLLGLFLSAAVCCGSVSFSLQQYVAARSLSLCGSMLLLGLFLSAAVCCCSVSFSLRQFVAAHFCVGICCIATSPFVAYLERCSPGHGISFVCTVLPRSKVHVLLSEYEHTFDYKHTCL